MYYFAYGSNLNKAQMAKRCPKARPVGRVILPNARLIFRGVADVESHDTREVHGGLWQITKECEKALDRYEGVKNGLYRREFIRVAITHEHETTEHDALIYLMNAGNYCHPSEYYLGTIRMGFRDFGIDRVHLNQAVDDTAEEVGHTFQEYWGEDDSAPAIGVAGAWPRQS